MGAKYKKVGTDKVEKVNPWVTYGILAFVFIMLVILINQSPSKMAPLPAHLHKNSSQQHIKHHHVHSSSSIETVTESNGASLLDQNTAPSNSAPSASAPSNSAPSATAPSEEAALDEDDDDEVVIESKIEAEVSAGNPYVAKHITPELRKFWQDYIPKKKAKAEYIVAKWGNWCVDKEGVCLDCMNQDRTSVDFWSKFLPKCPGKGHTYDNASNWDFHWSAFCTEYNDDLTSKFPLPTELKPYIYLNYEQMHAEGHYFDNQAKMGDDDIAKCKEGKSDEFAKPFASGSPSGELPFDVVTVRDHFQKLQAALTWYNQGEAGMAMAFKPDPESPDYDVTVNKIADQFASVLVSGGELTIGILGDSVSAGADNCYYDAWPSALTRQLTPLFAAANITVKVQNGAHNGGYPMGEMVTCVNGIFNQLDILLQYGPFVGAEEPQYEHMVRSALAQGIIVGIGGRELPFDEYHKHGYFQGPSQDDYLLMLEGYEHFPQGPGKGHWGRLDDSLCHVPYIRSGSRSIHSRNWHPGPARHQMYADRLTYYWSVAIIKALDNIAVELKKSGGKVAPLKAKWPRNKPTDLSEMISPPLACEVEKVRKKGPRKQVQDYYCNKQPQQGFPACRGIVLYNRVVSEEERLEYSKTAPMWDDWMVDDLTKVPKWGSEEPTLTTVNAAGPMSKPRWGDNTCEHVHDYEKEDFIGAATLWKEFYQEPKRSKEQCKHVDFFRLPQVKLNEWVNIKIPAKTMTTGYISLCGTCMKNEMLLTIMMQTKTQAKKVIAVDWDDGDIWGHTYPRDGGHCGTVSVKLTAAEMDSDVYIGAQCPADSKQGHIAYVFAL